MTPAERFPRGPWRRLPIPADLAALGPVSASSWTDGRTLAVSALEILDAPDGRGDQIPQWHVSISDRGRRPSDRLVRRALKAFGMVGAEEDNHHPGQARHFFLVVDKARRVTCERKATETIEREPDGYTWTNPTDGPCRGCEHQAIFGTPCPVHARAA